MSKKLPQGVTLSFSHCFVLTGMAQAARREYEVGARPSVFYGEHMHFLVISFDRGKGRWREYQVMSKNRHG
jgi:hypothetical protein